MRLSLSPSASGRRLSARERRTIVAGAVVSVVALVAAFGVVPFARRWSAREALIAAKAEQLARLRSVRASEPRLREAVAAREQALAAQPQRLLSGRTPAVAAAALQSTLQGYADQSSVTVTSFDVAGAPDTTASALPAIPATLSAFGDIYGVTSLLDRIQHGPRVLEVRALTLRLNPSLRGPGEMLSVSVTVRAPYVTE